MHDESFGQAYMLFTELPCSQTLQSWQLFSLSLFSITIPRSLTPPFPMCLGESQHHHYLSGFAVEENELGYLKYWEPIVWMTDINNQATGAWAGLPSIPFQCESNWAYFPRRGQSAELQRDREKDEPQWDSTWGWWSWGFGGRRDGRRGEAGEPKALMPLLIKDPESSSGCPGSVGSRRQCYPSLNASFLKHQGIWFCFWSNQKFLANSVSLQALPP